MKFCFRMVVYCLLLAVVSACVSTSSRHTDFLTVYSKLKPDPKVEGLFFYENSQNRLHEYDSFMIAPILIYFSPKTTGHGVDPERLLKVTEYFHNRIPESFAGRYRIVPTPGPGVCVIRIAMTHVFPEKPKMAADANTKVFGLLGANLEVQFQDSKTGEPVMALWDTRQTEDYKRMHEQAAINHARNTIHKWIETMMKYMDQAYAERPG